jgi:hypothetical protein
MHPILHRVARAYRPLAGRNCLVEGPQLPLSTSRKTSRQRMTLLALVAALSGRRP